MFGSYKWCICYSTRVHCARPLPSALKALGEPMLAFSHKSSIPQLPGVPQLHRLETGVPLLAHRQCTSLFPKWSSRQAGVLPTCCSIPNLHPHSNCVGCVSTDYLVANARPKLNGTARSLGRPSLNPAGTLFILLEPSNSSQQSLCL